MSASATLKEKSEMAIMGEEGDTKVMWSEDNPDEVEVARKAFHDLRGKGYTAFKVDRKGAKGEVMTAFDPHAEAIIMAPQLRGG